MENTYNRLDAGAIAWLAWLIDVERFPMPLEPPVWLDGRELR